MKLRRDGGSGSVDTDVSLVGTGNPGKDLSYRRPASKLKAWECPPSVDGTDELLQKKKYLNYF